MSQPRHPKVDQPRLARLVDQDVIGLDVAMDDPLPVRVVGCCCNLRQQGSGLARLEPAPSGDLLKGLPAHIFHHDVRPVVMEVAVIHPDQVGMVELCEDLAFLDDLAPAVGPNRCQRELQHQVLAQPRMYDPEDVRLTGAAETGR